MTTMCKRLLTAVSIAALSGATAVSPAFADSRGYRGGHYGGHHHRGGDRTGAYVALGLGAAALGALAYYSASRPVYYAPPAYYYPPPAPPPAYGYYYYGPPAGYVYDPYANTYVYDPQFDRPSN